MASFSGIFSEALALNTELFDLYKHVSDKYKAQCVVRDGNVVTTVATHILINRPPKDGNCTISPLIASATVDNEKQWEIHCWGWEDEDGIKDFHITSSFDDDEIEKEITSSPTPWNGFMTKVALPAGPAYRNHTQDVYVYVWDTTNAVARMKIATVTVTPPPEKDMRDYVSKVLHDDNHHFFKDLYEGDQRSVSELVTSLSLTLGHSAVENEEEYADTCLVPSTWLNTGYDTTSEYRDNMYSEPEGYITLEQQYECDRIRNDRAELRTKVTKFLLDMARDDITSIQQVSGALAELTSKPTEIDYETQESIMNATDEMLASLKDPLKMKNVPQEEIQKAMTNIYSVIGAIVDSAGSSSTFPTFTEMDTALNDASWKEYETSNIAFDDETDLRFTKSYEEALKIHTEHIHQKLAKEETSDIANKDYQLMNKMAGVFDSFAIPGQKQEATGYRTKYRLEKNFAENYIDEKFHLHDSKANVLFPDTMTKMFPSGAVAPKDVVTLQLVQNTNTAKRATKKASKYFPKDSQSHFLSVDLYDSNNDRVDVPVTNEKIRIEIPNDSNAPKPEKKIIDPYVTDWNQFMMHTTETPSNETDFHLNFEIEDDTQFVLVAKHDGYPSTNDTDIIMVVPPTVSRASNEMPYHRVIIESEMLEGKWGKWVFGIVQRNSTFINTPVPTNEELIERYRNGTGGFSSYNLTIFLTGCYHHKEGQEDWSDEGCEVSPETTDESTVCLCDHLTTFAGGLIVPPNIIDWNYVFDNTDFMSNPTLYITEIVVFLIFIIMFIFGRRKDVADVTKRGLAPLPDNKAEDQHLYEILVSTGLRRNAGTNSRVFFIMSGDEYETEIRVLSDTKRDVLKRGMTNGFLMSVPKSLGRIQYVRVWHDNSGEGKFGSWYLSYFAVRDLQTDVKYVFICNRWLAVEEDDGVIDRILPLAGKEQLADFSYQFGERSKKNLLDDHLWFSLVARPPESRFSCVERIACCLCLLFMTMMANAMFYNADDNRSSSTTTSFDVGPFTLSSEQLSIGFISTIIVFPVNFFLVFLFRKSHSRTIKASDDKQNKQNDLVSPSQVNLRPHSSKSTTSTTSKASVTSLTKLTVEKKVPKDQVVVKKSSCLLPWWCVIIAWILLIILTLGSAAIVTFYGITFGDETCKKWIASLIFSFLTSIFITQPLKVILLAMFLALIIKDPEEEEEEDVEVIVEDERTDFLHVGCFMSKEEEYKAKAPPTRKQLKQLRERRIKEVKMWAVMREIFFYLLFLWILMVIAHRNRGPDNFHYKNSMERTFIKSLDTKIPFNQIKTDSDFWLWAKSGLTGGLLAGSYYNDYPPLRLRTYINDKASKILGHAVLRQNRIKPNGCDMTSYFEDIIDECNTMYSFDMEEKGKHDVGWAPLGTTGNETMPEYNYTSADSLDGYPYWGYRGIYSGGGYVAHLNGSKQDILALLTRLENERWIDRLTRSVFVEFTVYNPQVNLFSMNVLLAEFDSSNNIITSYRFEPAMLLPYMTGTMVFQIICEIIFFIYLIIFAVGEMKNFYHQRLRYLAHFWNLVEICIISLSFTAVVIYFYRLYEINQLTDKFKKSQGNEYVKFQYVSYWNEIFSYIIGFIVFFVTLKFLKLLRFNQRVSMLGTTMKYSGKSLLHFGVIASTVFFAFVQLFFMTFMNVDESYSSFIESVVASILMMMGKFNIYTMMMVEPILTQIFVLGFVLAMTFIVVNMFISILNDAFGEVRGNIENQCNDYEIIHFILERFQSWLGYGPTNPAEKEVPNGRDTFDEYDAKDTFDNVKGVRGRYGSNIQMLPDRIERFLKSLSTATVTSGFGKSVLGGADWMNKQPYSAPKSVLEEQSLRHGSSKPPSQKLSLARVE